MSQDVGSEFSAGNAHYLHKPGSKWGRFSYATKNKGVWEPLIFCKASRNMYVAARLAASKPGTPINMGKN